MASRGRTAVVGAVLLGALTGCSTSAGTSAGTSGLATGYGRLTGHVAPGAPPSSSVPDMVLTFSSGDRSVLATESHGTYTVDLPAGIWAVRSSNGVCATGMSVTAGAWQRDDLLYPTEGCQALPRPPDPSVPPPPSAPLPPSGPEKAALAWFAAINDRNAAALRSLMEPGSEAARDWFAGSWAPSQWPTFTALGCSLLGISGDTARVHCDFDESQAPSVGNPDSFWNLGLYRSSGGSWLVGSYGPA